MRGAVAAELHLYGPIHLKAVCNLPRAQSEAKLHNPLYLSLFKYPQPFVSVLLFFFFPFLFSPSNQIINTKYLLFVVHPHVLTLAKKCD